MFLVLDLDIADLQDVTDMAAHFKILINQPDTHSLADILTLPLEGISINVAGENELKPGLKDFERLASILEELEVLD